MPVLLLLLFSLALSTGGALVMLVMHLAARQRLRRSDSLAEATASIIAAQTNFSNRPGSWLAIKTQNLEAVQLALGLQDSKPCLWAEALEQRLYITPPFKGWVVVVGSDLPDPSDDVDRCFQFVLELSRKLGHIQYFKADRLFNHHAWVNADKGRILRAYAWAGRTVWHEGPKTVSELELSLRCFGYNESFDEMPFEATDVLAANVDRIPLLAARWSVDPAEIEQRCGKLGER